VRRITLLAAVYAILLGAVLTVVSIAPAASGAPIVSKTFDYTGHPIIGTSSRETPPHWHCRSDDKNGTSRYSVRVCQRLQHVAKWYHALLAPSGGLEKAHSAVVGNFAMTDTVTGRRAVPYEVKMIVINDSSVNASQAPDHKAEEFICGQDEPCTRAVHGLRAEIRGFTWDYLFPPFGGCGGFETVGKVSVVVWPRKPAYGGINTILGESLEGLIKGKVCSGI
jgi:hypothetical protein